MTSNEWNTHPNQDNEVGSDFFADPKSEIVDLLISITIVILFLTFMHIEASSQPLILLIAYWTASYGIVKLLRYVTRNHH
ncbi:MAG: hypothetical protein EOM64_05980 [Erysipelotrichia bacterium]|nr:hypothetical protein [Erysipelotrichia bacterium]